METVAALRRLPPPASDDPRIDVEEALAARRFSDMATLERAAAAAAAKGRRSGERLLVARALLLQGSVPLYTGHPLQALPLFQEARNVYVQAGYPWGTAMASAHLGIAYYRHGDLARAEPADQEALAIAQQIGNVNGTALGLGNLGLLYRNQGDLPRARQYLERSRRVLAEIDDPMQVVWLQVALAEIDLMQGDFASARGRSEEVLAKARRTGSRSDEGRALGVLAAVRAESGALAEARGSFDRSLELLRGVQDPALFTPVLVEATDTLGRLGEVAAAREQAGKALALLRQAGYRLGMARLLGALSELSLRTGDLAAARAQAEEQLRLAREVGARDTAAAALQTLGRAALAAGDLPRARQLLGESLQTSEAGGQALLSAATRLDLAALSLADGKAAEAARTAREVASWCNAHEARTHEVKALSLLSEALYRQGLSDEARETAARVRSILEGSGDRLLQIEAAALLAPAEAGRGAAAQTVRNLRQGIDAAVRLGLTPAALQARLALGEVLRNQGDAAGSAAELQAVRKEAETRALVLLARRAAELAQMGRSGGAA
jgi:tetratricopeptide (TPR) repeat protein